MIESRESLISFASEFLNITEDEVIEKIKENPVNAVKDWHNKESIIDFYKTTDVYIFGLIDFCTPDRIDRLIHPFKQITEKKKVLEFGAGIGALLFGLIDKHDVYYYDLPSKTQEFAKFICEKRGYKVNFLTEEEMYNGKYDIIYTVDVLEHLETPLEVFNKLHECLNDKGYILTTGLDFSYGTNTPMHLESNLKFRREFSNIMNEKYIIRFFHSTPQEIIYMGVKK